MLDLTVKKEKKEFQFYKNQKRKFKSLNQSNRSINLDKAKLLAKKIQ